MNVFKNILGTVLDTFFIGKGRVVAMANKGNQAVYTDHSGVYRSFDMVRNKVLQGESLEIPEDYHMLAQGGFSVDGDLMVDGDFVEV